MINKISFQKNTFSKEWSKWIKLHRQNLLEIGIPDYILESHRRWWNFIEHGYDYEAEWDPSFLSVDDAKKFLIFLENVYKKEEASVCIFELRKTLNL